MRISRSILFLICLLTGWQGARVKAQETLLNPFEFPILLSANFGELRANHFHSGLDFKTQGVEGKPIHVVADGYVSRIGVSPWGYGNVLYITHPGNGTTTVYGHMQKFNRTIAAYVKKQQYEKESFAVDLQLTPEQIPVKQGDIIGLAGNSGGSGGPHLHFEVRDTETEEATDPLPYFKDRIKDTQAPKLKGVRIIPAPGQGVANGSQEAQQLKLVTAKDGRQAITGTIDAWGKIGFSIYANDHMTGTSNIYGVKEITLAADSIILFHSNIDRFAFNETRYLNSWIDYEHWRQKRVFYTNLFTEPGNKLRFIQTVNRGYLYIREEGTYHLILTLKDYYGNTTKLSLWIEGKEQPVEPVDTTGTQPFHWITDNQFGAKGIRLLIPKGNLYSDLDFKYSVTEQPDAIAARHELHDRPVPLHQSANLSLRLLREPVANKSQYGIVALRGKQLSWIGGTYRDSWLDGNIRELGTYTIRVDSVAPRITPLRQSQWLTRKQFAFTITDNLSGIAKYRGEIDGEFVLFEMDGKKALITYNFDRERLKTGKHELKLTVTDACGNASEYRHSFTW